jgi:hypothetical protein
MTEGLDQPKRDFCLQSVAGAIYLIKEARLLGWRVSPYRSLDPQIDNSDAESIEFNITAGTAVMRYTQ